MYRRLAEANPDAYLPDLARSLHAFALVCVWGDRNLPEAHQAVTEAVELYAVLADQMPQAFGEQLGWAYRTLADVLDRLGRAEEAAQVRQLDAATVGEDSKPA